MKELRVIFLMFLFSTLVVFLWDTVPFIKNFAHLILDNYLQHLLFFNVNLGMVVLAFVISLISTILHKYLTDQKALKEIREEQKKLSELIKNSRNDPAKSAEYTKKSLEISLKSIPLTFRPLFYTLIPIILLFRWLNDFFSSSGLKVLGMSWILAYILLSIVFSSILRKLFKVY
ncbi:MAG: EMC3/TMCO1 family protein [Candidatus Pacearchaeota archaeon]